METLIVFKAQQDAKIKVFIMLLDVGKRCNRKSSI